MMICPIKPLLTLFLSSIWLSSHIWLPVSLCGPGSGNSERLHRGSPLRSRHLTPKGRTGRCLQPHRPGSWKHLLFNALSYKCEAVNYFGGKPAQSGLIKNTLEWICLCFHACGLVPNWQLSELKLLGFAQQWQRYSHLPLLCHFARNLGKRGLALMSPSIPGALYNLSTAKHNVQLPEQAYVPTSNIDSLC